MLSTLQKEQKELKTFLVEQKTNAGNSVKERSRERDGWQSPRFVFTNSGVSPNM